MSGDAAVLLAAYGAPASLAEVEPYLLDVRGGRPTAPAAVRELRDRYAAIGGRSPLLERTLEQAAALAAELAGPAVYVGMRHWHPYLGAVLAQMRADGVRRVVAIPLAPHFSSLSIGAYERRIDEGRGALQVALVRQWYDHPLFLDAVAGRVCTALRRFEDEAAGPVTLLFTAHSLPERILAEGDPYLDQLRASVAGVLRRVGHHPARFAFQSAGRTDEPWLGPDAATVLEELADAGSCRVLVCPIGFVSDHLEVLYDIDVEYRQHAARLGLRLERTESLNASPLLVAALAALVRTTMSSRGWAGCT